MGLERENRTRKHSKNIDGSGRQLIEESSNSQVVFINGKHLNNSTVSNSPHGDEKEARDLIFQSINLPPSSNPQSVSVNLPPASRISLNINLPSNSSVSLKIPPSSSSSHPSSTNSASSFALSFQDCEDGLSDGRLSTSNELLEKQSEGNKVAFPSPNLFKESFPLDLKPAKLPPIHQKMDRSDEKQGGYDPSRIPLHIFKQKPATPFEWSAASNDSLFSLHLGRNDSLQKEPILSLSDMHRFEGEEFKFNQNSYSISMSEEEASEVDEDATKKVENVVVKNENDFDAFPKSTKSISNTSDADSSSSFQFPILADEERVKSDVVRQHLEQLALNHQQHMKANGCTPTTPSKARKKTSATSRCCGCFRCFSCSLWYYLFSCGCCRSCSSCCCHQHKCRCHCRCRNSCCCSFQPGSCFPCRSCSCSLFQSCKCSFDRSRCCCCFPCKRLSCNPLSSCRCCCSCRLCHHCRCCS